MKKFTLSAGERLAINNLLNDLKGGLQQINMGFKIMDKVMFNEKEQKALGMKQEFAKSGLPQLTWNISKDKPKEIEFSDDQAELVKQQIQLKSDKGEMSISDRFLMDLAKKLGMDIGVEEEKKEEKEDGKKK